MDKDEIIDREMNTELIKQTRIFVEDAFGYAIEVEDRLFKSKDDRRNKLNTAIQMLWNIAHDIKDLEGE